jgi:acyl-CoA thioesterase FadM
MTSYVAVVGSGSRAAGWATRWLASGWDVITTDPGVPAQVRENWSASQRLGLFPGSSLDRLTVSTDADVLAGARLVQLVGDLDAPRGARLVATDLTAYAHEPIHIIPLVQLHPGDHVAELTEVYRSIGMAPCTDDIHPLERWRLGPALIELTNGDTDSIIAVMRALRATDHGAGVAMAHHEAMRFSSAGIQPWQPGDVPAAPLAIYDTLVEPDWVDYNAHMTEAAYLTAAGWASDALFRYIGDDEAYRAAGHSFYTVETHIHYLLEVDVHEPLHFTTQILGVDAKRVHLIHEMFHGQSGALLCTAEQMLVHVDMNAGRSVAILPHVAAALAAIRDAHASLPIPPQVGSVMRLPPPKN